MRAKRNYTYLIIFLLPLLFFLQNPKVSEPVRAASLTVISPLLNAGRVFQIGWGNLQKSLSHFVQAFQSQEKTQRRIAELESELVRFKETLKENDRLKKLLEFRQTITEKTIAARVLAWDSTPWRKTLILDKGASQGIKKDMAVVVAEGLVGRVLEVGPLTARVILLMDSDARVSALTDESRAQGVIAGDGSSELKMQYLELEGSASVGETVLTSGLGGMFPKGIRIGKIINIGRDETGLHLTARVEPFVHFTKLEEVLCLASSQRK